MTRDISQREFDAACRKYGFRSRVMLGYYSLPTAPTVMVSVLNAGTRRRDQLAYLLKELERHERKAAQETT